MVLQGVADVNYKLICIDVGGYGKQSDGGTLHCSDFYKLLSELPETNIKASYVLIADEAYPLLDFLLKPFGEKNVTLEHELFNNILSRARKTIECTFGILYLKWRIFLKKN